MVKLINTRNNRIKWIVCILVTCACVYAYLGPANTESKESLNLIEESENKTQEVNKTKVSKIEVSESSSNLPVHFWIDIPNDFPWRNCLQEYNRALTLLHCHQDTVSQHFLMEQVPANTSHRENDTGQSFKWKTTEGAYIVPGMFLHEGVLKETLILNDTSEEGFWTWTHEGQVRWSQGCRKCVTSLKANQPLSLSFCQQSSEDQNVEIGRYQETGHEEEERVLRPLDVERWRFRQEKMRNEFLAENKVTVIKALAEIDEDDLMYVGGFKGEARRAAVFYVDKGKGAIANVKWWIYSWKFIGLNVVEEAFDLVMMVHPAAIENLPIECKEVTEGFHPNFGKAGECLYKPYIGITYRDKSYDGYMNSQECLFGPGSEFLSQYKVLLRADLDTFPTPRMLGYWPEGVVADKGYGTMMGMDTIMDALRQLACSVGIEHQGWFNIGSSWYGDGRRVRNLAKLTVALNKYGRAEMFGPGTHCRCAECANMPKDCEWGGGPYAGVLLLYLQEIAINKVLTLTEWKNLPTGFFDQGVTDDKRSVCSPAVLHCLHNAELFSKLAFGMGKYQDFDMSSLDITTVRDYATFMALTSNNQGVNGEVGLVKLKLKMGNSTWSEFCLKI